MIQRLHHFDCRDITDNIPMSMQTEQNRRIAQQQIDAVQSQQLLQLSGQLLANPVTPLAPTVIQPSRSTNCTSRYNRIGNTVQTTCD